MRVDMTYPCRASIDVGGHVFGAVDVGTGGLWRITEEV